LNGYEKRLSPRNGRLRVIAILGTIAELRNPRPGEGESAAFREIEYILINRT
jgi:hypothetical protein